VWELAPGVADERDRDELTLEACNQLLSLGWRMGGSEAEAAAVFAEGRALTERLGDRRALALACAGGCYYYEAQAQLTLAAALLATDGVVPRAEIESALARAEQLVESIEERALSPRILELRGRLAAALGDAPGAEQALRHALELYRTIGATGHAARLTNEVGGSA
jgi:hypothetical protein